MEYNGDQPIWGCQSGVICGQYERVDELNMRMQTRHFPDVSLTPNFDPRPIPTKQSLFPIMNARKDSQFPILSGITHSVKTNFNPGTHRAPPCGYFTNIDTETLLRNQTTVLQHGADQNVYVPSSYSDLYKVNVVSSPSVQPFPGLFKSEQLHTNIPSNLTTSKIGKDRFANHTRTQLRNS